MIVISGALVLVALVLLIIGVASQSLPFVYASIAVSLVSLVFLVVGILQRRGEPAPASESAGPAAPQPTEEPADSVTAVIPSQGGRRTTPAPARESEPPAADSADEELSVDGTVLVVTGRPRYHVGGCRYLTGKAAEPVDVLDAREEGFTPCGVCKPDETLEQAGAVETGAVTAAEDAPANAPAKTAPAKTAPAKTAPAKTAPAKIAAVKPAAAKTAARKAPAKKAPAATAAPAKTVKAPGRTAAVAAPSRAATAAAAASPASRTATKRAGSVVVIPDRGKFHTADCRYVRDADDAEVLSKAAATRQGYTACGVCRP